jgi:cyclic pyranopterin phosphate synthase
MQAAEMEGLTHLNDSNQPRMVDVSAKAETTRTATASCLIHLGRELMSQIQDGELKSKKGPVFHTAILAGISGTKKTSELIPLCHPLPLDSAQIEIVPHGEEELLITATAKTSSRTGVEMEALTGASVAALTLYDMCKAVNPAIIISDLKLLKKSGGKSDYQV